MSDTLPQETIPDLEAIAVQATTEVYKVLGSVSMHGSPRQRAAVRDVIIGALNQALVVPEQEIQLPQEGEI